MFKVNRVNAQRSPVFGPILLVAVVLSCLSSNSNPTRGSAERRDFALDAKAKVKAIALRAALKTAVNGFRASLEMEENVDFLLAPPLSVQEAMARDEVTSMRFDATIELNAPLCRTYVVLFGRYWVSLDSYRLAVVWAEPHAGSLNFPIYPPTLNMVSDPNRFMISHQIQHMYDGVFPKPLGERGPFRHKFNVYFVSDIRFAERETLDLRVRFSDIGPLLDADSDSGKRVLDMNYPQSAAPRKEYLAKTMVRATGPRVDQVTLLDPNGRLLKTVQYEYGRLGNARRLKKQTMLLPERPITVAFKGEGPTITIGGQKRQYPQLEIIDLPGGRKWIVDYQATELRGRTLDLPSRIEVYTGDGKQLLRRARMYNVTACDETPGQVAKSPEQFSHFDSNETQCRQLLIKHWLKGRSEVAEDDIETLGHLRKHLARPLAPSATIGEKLKRVNMLQQVDWMLDDPNALVRDFREYMRLLRSNGLGRMVLFGGENVIETTSRWAQSDTADKLLPVWLNAAISENDMASILDFAAASLAKGRLWTTAKLLEKALANSAIPVDQRFVGQALRAVALSSLCEMVESPDHIKTEPGIAQARWALWGRSEATLRQELHASATAARKSFAVIDRPTRQHRTLKTRLDAITDHLLTHDKVEEGGCPDNF